MPLSPFARRRGAVVLVLLALVLTFPTGASAAPPTLAGRAWSALERLWAAAGCIFDPDGRCLAAANGGAHTDQGCIADPNGRCLPSAVGVVQAEQGCIFDPNGRCQTGALRAPQPAPKLDEGCIADPSGRCHS